MAFKTSIVIEKLPKSNQLQGVYYSPLFDEHALPVPSVNDTTYPLIPGTTKMNNRLTVENHPIPGGNSSGCFVTNTHISTCGGNGIYTAGEDANTCQFIGVMINNCQRWGILEASRLGNIYIGCNVTNCGNGGIKALYVIILTNNGYEQSNDNSASFINCYTNGTVLMGSSGGLQQWFSGYVPDNIANRGTHWTAYGQQISKGEGTRFINTQEGANVLLSMSQTEYNSLLNFGHKAIADWVLAHKPNDNTFKFIQSSAAADGNHGLSLSNANSTIPQGNVWFPDQFYLSPMVNEQEEPTINQSVATNAGKPEGYFAVKLYTIVIQISATENKMYYILSHFPKVGDIVFNSNPTPDDESDDKLNYIGYMCVQAGVPEIVSVTDFNTGETREYVNSIGGIPNMLIGSDWRPFGRILVFLLSLLLAQTSYGQGFLQTYDITQWFSGKYINGVLRHDDSGYLTCVVNDTLQYWLLDNKGNIIEKRNLQTPEDESCDIYDFLSTSDGNYLISGEHCLTKVNEQGDSIWYKCCASINKSLSNGNYLYVGAGSYLCPNGEIGAGYAVYSFSPEINLLNDTTWATETVGEGCWNVTAWPSSVADTEKVLIAGHRFRYSDLPNPRLDIAQISLTDFGQVLWRTIGPKGIAFDVKALSDGSYLVAAGVGDFLDPLSKEADSLQIIKYSATGNIVRQKTIEINAPSIGIDRAYFLKNIGGNELILAGNGARFIVAIDTLGNKLWQKNTYLNNILPDLYSDYDAYVVLQEDDGYLISGSYTGVGNQHYAFLARIDSTGSCRPQAAFSLVQTDSLVSVSNASFGGDHYTWLWGNGAAAEDSTEQAQQYIYPQTGSYSLCLVAQNLCGSDTLCQIVNHFAAGIGSLAAETSLLVSPNPANQQLSAHFAALRSVGVARLYGSTGQLVAEQTLVAGSSQVRFATQALPSGVYVLSVSSADWAARQRVVIRH